MTIDAQSLSLKEAVNQYLASLSPEARRRVQTDLSRFAGWFKEERAMGGLAPSEIESFAEGLSVSDVNYLRKVDSVKAFLAYAKKKEWTKSNLGVHLKPKRTRGKSAGLSRTGAAARKNAPEPISMTRQGHTQLKEELTNLKEERHKVIAEVRKAAADKDFRENAPLHAAREKRGHIEGRIMEIEGTLKSAVIIETEESSVIRVNLGDSVVMCESSSEEETCYMLVGPKEADIIKGKISSASPMGQAILGREQGETVEIDAPMGKIRYSIKRIDR